MGALHVGLLSLLAASAVGDFDFDGVKASATQASPLGFFNDHGQFGAGVGAFTLGATDHVNGPDLTYGDSAQFQARFTEGADEYQVELIAAGFPPVQALPPRDQKRGKVPPPPGHRIDGGVVLDTDVFGTAGLGPPALARAHAAVAVFGVGRVFKNGRLLTDRARVEVTALSDTVLTPDGQMLLTPQEGRSQLVVIADNLPPTAVAGGVLEFGFNDVQIVVDGAPVNPPAGVAMAPAAGPGGEQAGVGGAGEAGAGEAAAAPGEGGAAAGAGGPMAAGAGGAGAAGVAGVAVGAPTVVPSGTSAMGVTVSPAPAPTAAAGTTAAAGGATSVGTGGIGGAAATGAASTGATASTGAFIGAPPATGGVVGAAVPLAPGLSLLTLPAPAPVSSPTFSRDLSETLNGRLPLNQRSGVSGAVGNTLAAPGAFAPTPGIGATTAAGATPVGTTTTANATPVGTTTTANATPAGTTTTAGATPAGTTTIGAGTTPGGTAMTGTVMTGTPATSATTGGLEITNGSGIFATPTLTPTPLAAQPSAPAAGTPGAPAATTAGTPGAAAVGGPGALGLGPETTGGILNDRSSVAPGFQSIGSPRAISSQTQVPGRSSNAPASFSSVGIPATPEPLTAQPATPLPFTPSPLNAGPAAALPLTPAPANGQLVGAAGTPGAQVAAGSPSGTGATGQGVPAGTPGGTTTTATPGSVTGAPGVSGTTAAGTATTATGTATGTAATAGTAPAATPFAGGARPFLPGQPRQTGPVAAPGAGIRSSGAR